MFEEDVSKQVCQPSAVAARRGGKVRLETQSVCCDDTSQVVGQPVCRPSSPTDDSSNAASRRRRTGKANHAVAMSYALLKG